MLEKDRGNREGRDRKTVCRLGVRTEGGEFEVCAPKLGSRD